VAVAVDDVPTVTLTAPTADALRDAVLALGDEEVLGALTGTTSALRPSERPRRGDDPAWADGVARLDELGVDERRVVGPGPRTLFFGIDRPLDVRLERTRLDLVVDASGALTDASVVQASVNGTVIGTRRLEPGLHTYPFDVPARVADRDVDGAPARTLDLALDVVLDLPDGDCQTPDPEAARATVLGRSAFTVETAEADVRELGRFPATFDRRPLVVHGRDGDDRTAALQVAAAYGRWSPDARPPAVAEIDDLDDGDLTGRDLVLLGDAVADQLGAGELADLPVVQGDDGADAVLGAVASPVDDAHDAFVIRGQSDGVLATSRLLADRELVAGLAGRTAALDGDLLEVVERVPADELPEVDEEPAESPDGTEQAGEDEPRPDEDSWVIPSLVLLGVLVLVALAVVRYRWLPVRR